MKKTDVVITIKDIQELLDRLENRIDLKFEKFALKIDDNARQYRDETLTKMDGVMKELEQIREDREMKAHHDKTVKQQLSDHEKRIKKLETN